MASPELYLYSEEVQPIVVAFYLPVGTRANLQLRTFVRGVSQFAYMYIVKDKMTFECACHIMDRIV